MDYKEDEYQHRAVITNRENTTLEGVIHVDSFDDQEVILETDLGMVALRGENLHIKHLDLDTGELAVEGIVKTLEYLEEGAFPGFRTRGKGLLGRLFR